MKFKFKVLIITIISLCCLLLLIQLINHDYNIPFIAGLNEIINANSTKFTDNARNENILSKIARVIKTSGMLTAYVNTSINTSKVTPKRIKQETETLAANQIVNISRIIHQSWKDNHSFSSIFHRYMPSWKQCFPNWQYKLWTDKDNRELVKKFYPWFLSKYDSFPKEIYRADVSRYFYMFHYGGIYTDLDNECLKPFEHLLTNHKLVFGDIDHVPKMTKLTGYNYVQNSFMYSVPNHPFWLELLLDIYHSKSSSTADNVTGPLMLSNMIERYKSNYLTSAEEIKIYSSHYFNPITWGMINLNRNSCKIFNMMTDLDYSDCRNFHRARGAYVVQFHTHVW